MNTKLIVLALLLGLMPIKTLGQPVIVAQPQDQTNVVGSIATFSVTATDTLALTYQWAFGSSPVNLDGATNATLMVPNLQSTNQGPYQVVLSDNQFSVTSSVAHLYVVVPATFQFRAGTYSVAESAGSIPVTVTRSGWLATAVSVDYATINGTATNGLKYTTVSGTLTFAVGETNKTIVVPILNEGYVEGTKSFRVLLSNPTGAAVLGSPASTTIFISDNDLGTQFQSSTYSVAEDAGAVILHVVRGDDGVLPVSVDLATSDATATNGLDYTGLTTTLSFAAQERLKLVSIPILNNALKQPNRVFRASLANPVGVSLGSAKTATVTILDNDQGFQFDSPRYTVTQDAGVVRVGVLRGTDDTNSTVSADVATSDFTATNGVDYVGISNTVQFAAGEKVKFVAVHLLNNGLKGPSRTFQMTLVNPTGGAVLGTPASVIVTILNSALGVGFESASYSNAWGAASNIIVTVLRGNTAALGPITVDYATSSLTAMAGVDYEAVSGTLRFQQNETAKSITISILRSRAAPGAKNLRVNLSNPTGGAALGRASTVASIIGAYVTIAPPFDTALSIRQEDFLNIVNWSGGGELQRADSPAALWQRLTNALSPFAVQSPLPATFYRVSRPRPVDVYVPSGYSAQTPMPLVLLLHGYTVSGAGQEAYMQIGPLAESRGFLYCHPDGTTDGVGNQFWNATDSCCDFGNLSIDDAGYLRAVVEEIAKRFSVDRKRIYLIGYSNGSFMAYRMACQNADLIAGIAGLGGETFLDPARCAPSGPVNILHIQGTADDTVPYAGGALSSANGFPANTPAFPGALQTVQLWAGYNGARDPMTDSAPTLDLTTDVPGLDTIVTRYTNAPPGGAVELWTINGGNHVPTLSAQFSPLVIAWLLAHPKP